MKRLFVRVAVIAAVWAGPLFAQGNAAKPVSRADFVKRLDTRFNGMDANHDGSLSKAELAAEQQRELQRANSNVNSQLQAKFKQLDTNKDGQLSLREFLAAAPAIRTSETPDQVLQKVDSNRDGKVSGAEYRAPQLATFDRADANRDGIVTPAEEKAAAGRK